MLFAQRLRNEMLWVTMGSLVSICVVLAGTRFLTTFLSLTEYGRLALMISLAGVFDQVAGHAVGGAAMRFFSIYRSENKQGALRVIIFRCWVGSAIICALGAIVVSYIQWPTINYLYLLTFGFSIVLLISGVGVRLAEGARLRQVSATFRTSFELIRFGLAAIFIYFGSSSAEFAMGGFLLGACIIAFFHWYYVRFQLLHKNLDSGSLEKRKQLNKSFRNYALPLLFVGLGVWVFLMSPIWALRWFCDISDVGVYGAYHQLAFIPMLIISGILLTYLAPIVYEKALESSSKAMKDTFRLSAMTMVAVILAVAIAYFNHPYFAKLLMGEHFRSNSWIFPWLILAGGFYGITQQLLLKLRAEMKTLKLAAIQLTFALLALIFYSFMANLFAVVGVVYAVAILNTLLLLLTFILGGIFQINPKSN